MDAALASAAVYAGSRQVFMLVACREESISRNEWLGVLESEQSGADDVRGRDSSS